MGNQVGRLQCIFSYIFVENDPWLGLIWSLLINIYEDNASKLLLNAFMKNVHILGSLSFRVAAWKHNLCGGAENRHRRFVKWCIVRQLKIKSSAQWHHLAVRRMHWICHIQALRTWGNSFIFLNKCFLIFKMGVLVLHCEVVVKEKQEWVSSQLQWHFFPFTSFSAQLPHYLAGFLLVKHQFSRIQVSDYFRTIPKCWQCWTWTCIWIGLLNY